MSRNLKGSPKQGRKRLEEISAAVNLKFGEHVALPLAKAATARILKLPFGILEIDWRTGGGIPINRISRIWGKPSSLKSTTCLRLVRNAQHYCRHCKLPIVTNPSTGNMDCACPNPRWTMMDATQFNLLGGDKYDSTFDVLHGVLPKGSEKKEKGFAVLKAHTEAGKKTHIEFMHADRCEPFRCLYIDTEGTTDEAWALANGVDTSLLLLIGGNWAEQVLDLTEDLILTTEVDFIVLDSLDMLTPGDTLEKSLAQTPRVANKANVMTRAMQKWTSAINAGGLLNRYTPTIVMVGQVRAKDIGKAWASLGPSGGWAVGHGISLDVKMTPRKYEYKGEKALFGNFECLIAKSKVGGFPKSKGQFRYWLKPGKGKLVGDTEDTAIVMEHAEKLKYIEKTKGKWALYSRFLEKNTATFKTKKALTEFLETNLSVYMDLRNRVLSELIGEDVSITLPSEKIAKEEKKKAKKKKMITVAEAKAKKAKYKPKTEEELDDEVLDYI